jgi:hypothetical protein
MACDVTKRESSEYGEMDKTTLKRPISTQKPGISSQKQARIQFLQLKKFGLPV